MSNLENAIEQLRRRFEHRLAAALDAKDYPANRLDRTKVLGSALGIDTPAANSLLGGYVLPDYPQLVALSELLDRQPGYFLDERIDKLPAGTVVVKPLAAGEMLVLRLPSDALRPRDIGRGLVYYVSKADMGFGIRAGEYLIAFEPGEQVQVEPRRLFLFTSDEGVEVRKCVEVGSGRAVFHSDEPHPVPLIVPTSNHGPPAHFSRMVASIRCGDELHLPPS